jgi:hypothetical protein
MADITITAASVAKVSGGTYEGIAGATITAGQACYLDAADSNKIKLARSDTTAEAAAVRGIALHGSLANQPIVLQTSGVIAIGATVVLGGFYALSDTPGGICPTADVGASEFSTLIGIANTVAQLTLNFLISGVEHA